MIGRAVSAVLAAAFAAAVVAAQTKPPKDPKSPYVKLAEPWPDAETMLRRKEEAERRPLFSTNDPLLLVIKADFKAINKDRTANSARRFPATLRAGADVPEVPIELSSRGHFRLREGSCSWVPLRVHFRKDVDGVFAGQSSLKLVTHCRDNDDFEQHVLREYVPYRIYALVSPLAFRARLARIAYVDATTARTLTTRYGMFIEDDGDVAKRAGARSIDLPRTLFSDLDQESLTTMALFEYMIANTDVSIVKLHNVKLMVTEQRVMYPVPYDFDFSGLVDAPYANPDPKLGISTVRDRIYRGPCRSQAEFEAVLEKFRAKKGEILALYDAVPDLRDGYRKSARSYIDNFYAAVERDRVKRTLVDGCVRAPGM